MGLTLLLSPVLVVEGALNASQRDGVMRAIEAADFPSRLGRALERRLGTDAGTRVSVVIQRYGFVEAGGKGAGYCFAREASVEATAGERVLLRETVEMTETSRSAGVPPPECAPLAEIGADDGRVARRILGDAAEIMAAVIVRHVEGRR
jgi:hypothetical protein